MDINPKINKTPIPENPLNQNLLESASILFNLKQKSKLNQLKLQITKIINRFSLGEQMILKNLLKN